ncbi:MAG: hypothetical protein RLN89_03460 [Parvibaculum sp.]
MWDEAGASNMTLQVAAPLESRALPLRWQNPLSGAERHFRAGGLPWELHRVIRQCAARGAPAPTNAELAARFDVPPGDVINALSRLCKAGLMVMETRRGQHDGQRRGQERCFVFPDDTATDWGLYATPQQKTRRQRRACMCCGQSFKSEGIHNRLCKTCTVKGD